MRSAGLAAAGALSLLILVVIESAAGGHPPSVPEALGYASVAASLAGSAIGLLRALLVAVERPLGSRLGPLLAGAVLTALVAQPLWALAEDFASGPTLQRLLGAAATPVLFAGALGLTLGLWLWQRLVLPPGGARPGRLGLGLAALGLALAAPLAWGMYAQLRAYAPLVDLGLALFIGLCGAGLVALLEGAPRRLLGALLALWTLAFAALGAGFTADPGALAAGRSIVVPSSVFAARVDRVFFGPVRAASLMRDPGSVDCPPARPLAPEHPRAKNLLILSIDTLRADALGWQREGRPLMPALHAFADASIYAPAAVSPYPATVFAMSSAFTGLGASRLLFAPQATPTVLSRAAALVDEAAAFLPDSPWFEEPAIQAMIVGELPTRRYARAGAQVDALLRTLATTRGEGERYVFWAHFFEPHLPNEPRGSFRFGDSDRERYEGELAYLDAELSRLFAYLERSGAYDDTLVVVFSDHGEALGERGYVGHHVYLDDFIADVPLILRAPGRPARRVEGPVALADVAASVADYVGLRQTPGSEGLSLLSEDPPAARVVVSEAFPVRGHELFALADAPITSVAQLDQRMRRVHESATRYAPKVAIVSEGHRLIVNRDSGLRELYRRGGGRVEDPAREARLAARLARWHQETSTAIYCAFE